MKDAGSERERERNRRSRKLVARDGVERLIRSIFCTAFRRLGESGVRNEDGATIVEMALASIVFLAMLFGIIRVCFAFYAFNYVSDAAREASRWAIVRGATSCVNTPNLVNCNATKAQIQSYVQGLGYPGINPGHLTVTTNFMTASATKPTTWSQCKSGTCNAPGNAVQVQVTYAFPLGIPFWTWTTVSLSSTSQMVISQ